MTDTGVRAKRAEIVCDIVTFPSWETGKPEGTSMSHCDMELV